MHAKSALNLGYVLDPCLNIRVICKELMLKVAGEEREIK